jgi:N-acetylglucosamine-6-phosphate deacetylase
MARHGTTAFLATTVSGLGADLRGFVTQVASCLSEDSFSGAVPIGVHLEGPWINPQAAGAQPTAPIRSFDARHDTSLLDCAEGLIKLVTLAPEIPGAAELQLELARRGIVAALGHSLADAQTVDDAVDRGARHVTHLFNAMGPLHQRAPGLAGAALGDDRLTCDLICDGAHVHPRMVAAAARAKGDRLLLITDRIAPPAPSDAGFGSGPVGSDGIAWRLPNGQLAGSRVTLDTALRNLRAFAGARLRDAVAACSLRPAQLLGEEGRRGCLRAGARADFAVLDADLEIRETWIGGARVYTR